MPLPQTPKDPESLRKASMLLTIPTMLVAAPLVGYFLGSVVDARFRTAPWGVAAGVVLGFVAAGRQITIIIRRVQAEGEDGKRR